MNDEELLHDLFYNKHNYSKANLYESAKIIHPKITQKIINDFIIKQDAYQVNYKPIKRHYDLPIFSDIPYNYQIDLTFMPWFKRENHGYYILFTAININTRYGFVIPLKEKTQEDILEAFKKLEEKTPVNVITSDLGTEFNNKKFIDYCEKNGIRTYFFKSDSHKLGIINRWHRTLKENIQMFFQTNNTVNWVDSIDDIVNKYNNTKHRMIKMKPIEMNSLYENMYIQYCKEKTAKIDELKDDNYEVGKKVFIESDKELFNKNSLTPKYDGTVYKIIKSNKNSVVVEDDLKRTKTVSNNKIHLLDDEYVIKEAKKENKKEY